MCGQKLAATYLWVLGVILTGCVSEISAREDQQTSMFPTREAERATSGVEASGGDSSEGDTSETYMTSGGDTSEEYMVSTLDREAEEGACGDVDQSCCEQVYCDEESCEVLFSCSSDYYACRIFIRGNDHMSVCFDVRDCGDLGNHCCVNKICSEGGCVQGVCER